MNSGRTAVRRLFRFSCRWCQFLKAGSLQVFDPDDHGAFGICFQYAETPSGIEGSRARIQRVGCESENANRICRYNSNTERVLQQARTQPHALEINGYGQLAH